MKRLKNKLKIYHRGFTLIELMVVISIIGLLSSIVLVALKDVKEKVNITKIKSEMTQLINALELYKTTTGKYPYEDTTVFGANYVSGVKLNNQQYSLPPMFSPPTLNIVLTGYISNFPKNPYQEASSTPIFWSYRSNFGSQPKRRCVGDTFIPKYIIEIPTESQYLYKTVFKDWPWGESFNGLLWVLDKQIRCFSFK